MVERHRSACQWFSIITICYHAFVVFWLFDRAFDVVGWVAPVLLTVVFILAGRWILPIAVLITIVSWVCFATVGNLPEAWPDMQRTPPSDTIDLVIFAAIAPIGFLLCPYLDLTFHRAAQQSESTSGGAPMTFLIGFGVVFFSMIIFSLAYAEILAPMMAAETTWNDSVISNSSRWRLALGVHMIIQASFTVAIHLRQLRQARKERSESMNRVMNGLCVAAVLALIVISVPRGLKGIELDEAIYRAFLIFYGVVFPAYMLMHVVPTRGSVNQGIRDCGLILAILVAFPLAWVGFVEKQNWFMVGAGSAILCVRIALDMMAYKRGNS
jgi:hypothetical protein